MVSADHTSKGSEAPKSCDKKIKAAEIKLNKILNKINSLKLNSTLLSKIELPAKRKLRLNVFNFYGFLVIAIIFGFVWISSSRSSSACLLEMPSNAKSIFRAPEDCSMCLGVYNVTRLSDISAEEFEDLYAYTTKPVIVTDATEDWKAIRAFDFKFFANFYRNGKMGKRTNDCFYFAYKSGLASLDDVFNMDEQRANLFGEPWYVGWSTCYDEETRNLRAFYDRPYFLPKTAESDMVDWIFMGGPGQGAHMHVDSVRHMSWQAQVRGRKRWELAPPPECLYRCAWITFTVEPGEILVVDTNRWYHRTTVLPGDISITIGAEYD